MSDSIVIIPTYNEKENIENIIRAVFGLEKVFHTRDDTDIHRGEIRHQHTAQRPVHHIHPVAIPRSDGYVGTLPGTSGV